MQRNCYTMPNSEIGAAYRCWDTLMPLSLTVACNRSLAGHLHAWGGTLCGRNTNLDIGQANKSVASKQRVVYWQANGTRCAHAHALVLDPVHAAQAAQAATQQIHRQKKDKSAAEQ